MTGDAPPPRRRALLGAVVLAGVGLGGALWLCCGIGETALDLLTAFIRD